LTVNNATTSIGVAGGWRDVVLRSDFEWALETEKIVEESSVWAVIDAFIGRGLRLVR
jgi:hypothetical protein